jgi:integrase
MAHLRKKLYTKPIPDNAELVTIKGVPSARFKVIKGKDKGKTVIAPLNRSGDRIQLETVKWYGFYTDAAGEPQGIPLFADKIASQNKFAEILRKIELSQAGISDPYEAHRVRPLAEHVADWELSMKNGGAGEKHARSSAQCVRRIIEGCKFVLMDDLSASHVQQFLADLRKRKQSPKIDLAKTWYTNAELARLLHVKPSSIAPMVKRHRLEALGNGKARRYAKSAAEFLLTRRMQGVSIKTSNDYLDAIKSFCRWMVQDRRMGESPLEYLEGGNVKLDRRHDRRSLDETELRRFIAAARSSAKSFRGMTGEDRVMLYAVACMTGYRVNELASLCPSNFNLDAVDAPSPEITLSAVHTKNGETAVQPLPPDLVAELRAYLAKKPADAPVWPGTWHDRAAEMLRLDLEACGIPYVVEGPDGPLFADFHALRHSYVALLDRSGATLKEAMELARHSDPKLTMKVYGRLRPKDLTGAVERLPSLLAAASEPIAETVSATGTDGLPAESFLVASFLDEKKTPGGTEKRCESVQSGEIGTAKTKPLSLQGVDDDLEVMRKNEKSIPRGIRTPDLPVRSRMLYVR